MFAALAVTLLMLLMASPAWQPQPNERENVVGRPGENPVAPVEAVAGNSPNELETERSGEPELPGRAAVAAASAPAPGLRERLSDALPRDVLAMLEMPMLESNDTVRAIEHMATGLRPIASSVEYTIDRLRQALPGTRSSMQEEKPQARVFRPAGWVA